MPRTRRNAFTLVQLVLAVFVMAVFIRIAFHIGDAPRPRYATAPVHGLKYEGHYLSKIEKTLEPMAEVPEVAPQRSALFVPFKVVHADSERGPLLARVIRQHHPHTTDEQIDGLVDTLPPSASPSVIVIIPSVEKPETPDAEKCRDPRSTDDDADADNKAQAEVMACLPAE
ncbi:MAG: hypothetical protein ACIAXF_08740 [Phycisphaerales bacterium JB063]